MNAILAIDTTTEVCSVALAANSAVHQRHELVGRGHSAVILEMVGAVLAEADISLDALAALACCRGPGSFTGVRIGVGVAHGLALGAGLGVLPVSTLATVAEGVRAETGAEWIAVAMDARMGEVYWGCFHVRAGSIEVVGEEIVTAPDRVALPGDGDRQWFGAGTGFRAHTSELQAQIGMQLYDAQPSRLPCAADALKLGQQAFKTTGAAPPEMLIPIYLRNQVTSSAG